MGEEIKIIQSIYAELNEQQQNHLRDASRVTSIEIALDEFGAFLKGLPEDPRERKMKRDRGEQGLKPSDSEERKLYWIGEIRHGVKAYERPIHYIERLKAEPQQVLIEAFENRVDTLKKTALEARKRTELGLYLDSRQASAAALFPAECEMLQWLKGMQADQPPHTAAPAEDHKLKQIDIQSRIIDVSDQNICELPAEKQSAISGQMQKNRQKLGINYDLRHAARIINVYDLVWAIKRAVLDYIEYVEVEKERYQQIKEQGKDDGWGFMPDIRSLEALQQMALSLEWAYYKPIMVSSEIQLEKIQSQITEKGHDLRLPIQIALTEWKHKFLKDRADFGLPEYSVTYIREQQAKCELEYDLGINVDREGEQFIYFLANIHALRWLFRVNKLNQFGTPAEDQEAKTPQTPKKDGRIKVEDREAYKRKMFPQMIELLCNGVTKTSASEIVAAPFGIKPNTVEIKFNKFMKSKKDAINLLKEIGRDDLIEKLNELNA